MSDTKYYKFNVYVTTASSWSVLSKTTDALSNHFKLLQKNVLYPVFFKRNYEKVRNVEEFTQATAQLTLKAFCDDYKNFSTFYGTSADVVQSKFAWCYTDLFQKINWLGLGTETIPEALIFENVENKKILLADGLRGLSFLLNSINSSFQTSATNEMDFMTYNIVPGSASPSDLASIVSVMNTYYSDFNINNHTSWNTGGVSWSYWNYVASFDAALTGGYEKLQSFLSDTEPIDIDNPYAEGEESSTGGGGGTFDKSSDTISNSDLPAISAIDSGFLTMYSPSLTELKQLSSWFWTDDALTTLKKVFASPLDPIISLSLTAAEPQKLSSRVVKLGGVSSGVSMPVVNSQYSVLDCGTVSLSEFFGAAADYTPNTKIELFLPYCGCHEISTDDVMAGVCSIKYYIDFLTGTCVAQVTCKKNSLNSVVYHFSGNINTEISVTSVDHTNFVRGIFSLLSNTAAGAIKGGAAGAATGAAGSIGDVLGGIKPTYQRSGSLGSSIGTLSVQVPYFIITRPEQSIPSNYQHYSGLPCNITKKLSDVHGYTECESVYIDVPNATENEKKEIEHLLKTGVIL